jgi:hypothetical protein
VAPVESRRGQSAGCGNKFGQLAAEQRACGFTSDATNHFENPELRGRAMMNEHQRLQRNLRPHAEARLAMAIWGRENTYEQNGRSMDFWDTLTDLQKRFCVDILDSILQASEKNGRAKMSQPTY